MSSFSKGVAGVAALVALAVLVTWNARSSDRTRATAGSERAAGTPTGHTAAGRNTEAAPARGAPEDRHGETTGGPTTPPRATARLLGRVLDGQGAPIPSATVRLRGIVRARPATTGPDGRFVVDVVPPPGGRSQTTVVAVASGHAEALRKIELKPGTRDVGDLVLGSGGVVAGKVVDSRGQPIPGAVVGVAHAEDRFGGLGPIPIEFLLAGARTRSNADGAFELRGVPVGTCRIGAGRQGYRVAVRSGVAVRRHERTVNVTIELVASASTDRFTGVVVDPLGAPVGGAVVRYSFESNGTSGSGSAPAKSDGTFSFPVMIPARYRFAATDPSGRWRGSKPVQAKPGDEVVLRLQVPRWLPIDVRDRGGRPMPKVVLMVRDPATGIDTPAVRDPAGRVAVPGVPFRLIATADGYAKAESEVLDPGALARSLRLVLAKLAGIRGVVRVGGRPLAGARVSLHRVIPLDRHCRHAGFSCRYHPKPKEVVRTPADGSYRLTGRERDRYVIRIEHGDFAPVDVGPFKNDPERGSSGRDADLTRGGVLEGRVITSAGRSAAGILVAVSRGDGHPQKQEVGADGHFRFGRLTPGPWIVRRVDGLSQHTVILGGKPPTPRWSCRVRDGVVTRFDLDTTRPSGLSVRGMFALAGVDVRGATVLLQAEGRTLRDKAPRGTLDSAGRFRIRVPRVGRYWITVIVGALRYTERIDLEREGATWERSLKSGTVVVHGVKNDDRLTWEGGGANARATISLVPDAERIARVVVPVGIARIGEHKITVRAGATVEIPR